MKYIKVTFEILTIHQNGINNIPIEHVGITPAQNEPHPKETSLLRLVVECIVRQNVNIFDGKMILRIDQSDQCVMQLRRVIWIYCRGEDHHFTLLILLHVQQPQFDARNVMGWPELRMKTILDLLQQILVLIQELLIPRRRERPPLNVLLRQNGHEVSAG